MIPSIEKYSCDIREYLESFFENLEDSEMEMYKMAQYHLGWIDDKFKSKKLREGKQFRGALCLAVSESLSGSYYDSLPIASSIELFHNFTLVHDDIEDNDELRRGRKTVWSIWGIPQAINVGDGMFNLSILNLLNIKKEEKRLAVKDALFNTFLKIFEGQYLDLGFADGKISDGKITPQKYLDMIERKTGCLIGAAAKTGAMAVTDNQKLIENFHDFGMNLGLSYQIYDDLVSIWGKSDFTGKKELNDLLEQKKTLPLIYAYSKLSQKDKKKLSRLFDVGKVDTKRAKEIVKLLDKADALSYCLGLSQSFKEKAKKSLSKTNIKNQVIDDLNNISDALMPNLGLETAIKVKAIK